tara:strand:+ start:88 stop:510 length:423 start_codon:yes stop_codon:yes gene_type:complete
MNQHMNGKDLTIFGDGEQKRAFTSINDCLQPMWKAATDERSSRQIINIGGTKEYTILEAAETLISAMGGGKIEHLEERHEAKYAWSSHDKSMKLLDYKDETDLESGIKEMWDWAKNQPARKQKSLCDRYEVTKGMYDQWK